MNPNQDQQELRLESWKEIAGYLQRDIRTAQRWEKEEGLPVHRHSHKRGASVYAFPSEIDAWRASRKAIPESAPPLPLWKSLLAPPRRWAFGVTLALCLVMVGNGLRPQAAEAQEGDLSARQVWITSTDGLEIRPSSVSRDGRYVTFTDYATGDLGVRDLMAGVTHRLTNTGGWDASGDYAERSVISPDNRWIAYTWWLAHEQRNELRVIPISGGTPRTVRRSENVQEVLNPFGWTPDGKQLLVLRHLPDRTKQIAMAGVEDGALRTVKSLGWPSTDEIRLSPDGRWVAYAIPAPSMTSRDVFLVATDGRAGSAVVENPTDDRDPLWSSDGSRLLFRSNRTGNFSLWAVPVKEGKAVGPAALVKASLDSMTLLGFTNAGRLFQVRAGARNSDLYSVQLGADGKVAGDPALAIDTYLGTNLGPRLSPDGKRVAYYSSRPQRALVIRTVASGLEQAIPTKLPISVVQGYGPMWFPDGRSVLVFSDVSVAGTYKVHLDTGEAELVWRLENPIETYTLSPDGKAFFVTDVAPGSGGDTLTTRLLRVDLGSGRTTVMVSGARFNNPAVSPDGKWLAYTAPLGSGDEFYWAVMPSEGGEPRELFRGTWVGNSRLNTLAWSLDQKWLYFVRSGLSPDLPNILWRIAVQDGGEAEPLGSLGPGNLRSPQPLPDGRFLFTATQVGAREVWAQGDFLPAK